MLPPKPHVADDINSNALNEIVILTAPNMADACTETVSKLRCEHASQAHRRVSSAAAARAAERPRRTRDGTTTVHCRSDNRGCNTNSNRPAANKERLRRGA